MLKERTGYAVQRDHTMAIAPSAYEVLVRINDGPAPRISVIVPTYDRRHMVMDALDALLKQDLGADYEVIVIDNGSRDGTGRALVEAADRATCGFTAVRLDPNRGAALARNVGLALARGEFVAFTDDDCIPSPGWLRACERALSSGLDAVQGRTEAPPWERKPLLSHYIQTASADGRFTTANMAYRRDLVLSVGGFNPACDYWEDVDLGWRAVRARGAYGFAADALVWHRVVVQPPVAWFRHVLRYGKLPLIASRYPEFRRYLFLGVWVDPFHALITLGAAGILLSPMKRSLALLAVPYLVAFPFRYGLRGRWPLLKAAAHAGRDCLGFAALLWASLRHKSPVL